LEKRFPVPFEFLSQGIDARRHIHLLEVQALQMVRVCALTKKIAAKTPVLTMAS
jgi:hypothetical protein